ncbi:MAG: M23 family metallopeptidase [Nitrospirae bacterium]|nr:M23 family metallopeptidase [Nitrospirota bacterium]
MNKLNYIKYKQNGFSRIGFTLIISFIILIISFFAYQLFFIPTPVLNGVEEFKVLPVSKTITLKGQHIKSIDISIIQGSKKTDLLNDIPETAEKVYVLQIKPKDLALSDGAASVVIRAKAGMFKKLTQDINIIIDTVPPSLEVLKTPEIINQGGAGFAVLRAKNADSVFLKLEDKTFPAFRATAVTKTESGSFPESGAVDYYVFFPVPFGVKESAVFHAVAKDIAGNQNVQSLHIPIKTAAYKWSSINIDDAFINTVASSLLNETSISDHEAAFKKVNEELRAKALEKLAAIAKETDSKILWKGAFLQLKNSKVMAIYGEKRTYLYKGKTISHSVHLGYDLASNAHSPVEAANSGIVRFAGDLSIYGNTVIIDHGMGLMSLYGHLSVINISEGQKVSKGDIIGKTGSTGLAGGDHLHFGILIHGYEISPLFWWDPHWIKVNVLDYLAG